MGKIRKTITKLTARSVALILFAGSIYYFGLFITGLFLGDLFQAESIVNSYSFPYKMLLIVLTGGIIGTFYFIYWFIYHLWIELFENHPDDFSSIKNAYIKEQDNLNNETNGLAEQVNDWCNKLSPEEIKKYREEFPLPANEEWVKEVHKSLEKDGFVTWPKLRIELKVSYATVIRTLDYMVKNKILLPPDEKGHYKTAK